MLKIESDNSLKVVFPPCTAANIESATDSASLICNPNAFIIDVKPSTEVLRSVTPPIAAFPATLINSNIFSFGTPAEIALYIAGTTSLCKIPNSLDASSATFVSIPKFFSASAPVKPKREFISLNPFSTVANSLAATAPIATSGAVTATDKVLPTFFNLSPSAPNLPSTSLRAADSLSMPAIMSIFNCDAIKLFF